MLKLFLKTSASSVGKGWKDSDGTSRGYIDVPDVSTPNSSFPYLYGLQSLANTTEDVYTPLLKEF